MLPNCIIKKKTAVNIKMVEDIENRELDYKTTTLLTIILQGFNLFLHTDSEILRERLLKLCSLSDLAALL